PQARAAPPRPLAPCPSPSVHPVVKNRRSPRRCQAGLPGLPAQFSDDRITLPNLRHGVKKIFLIIFQTVYHHRRSPAIYRAGPCRPARNRPEHKRRTVPASAALEPPRCGRKNLPGRLVWTQAMFNPLRRRKSRVPRATIFLAADAWLDSPLSEAGSRAREWWEAVAIFFRRFRVKGWRRGVVEVLSEGFTMGTAGSIVLLALALPAFEETAKDWRAQDDYAVTFLDRYGNEIGQRGIIQRDSVPVDE